MGKSGKKSQKGKRGKKDKKSLRDHMTFSEGMLSYRINVIEKKLEDVTYEIKEWEDRNEKSKIRNEKLKEEREAVARHMLNEYHIRSDVPEEESCSCDDVTSALKNVWDYRNNKAIEIDNYKRKRKEKDEEIEEVNKEIKKWQRYQKTDMVIESVEIRLLEQELQDLDITFSDMTEFLLKDTEKSKKVIKAETDSLLNKQKDLASENALSRLNKYHKQEFKDNEWLKREVSIQEHECAKLEEQVGSLETDNLEVFGKLFECQLDDVKINRHFFTTQVDEYEDLENGVVTMIDADLVARSGELTSSDLRERAFKANYRPTSHNLKLIEDRVLPLLLNSDKESGSECDSEVDEYSDGHESIDGDDVLELGPLDLTVLHVTGVEAPLHEVEDLDSVRDENEVDESEWTLDASTIHKAIALCS